MKCLIVVNNQEYMKGWYKDYCAKTGQFCDQVIVKLRTVYESQLDARFEPNCLGGDGPRDERPQNW